MARRKSEFGPNLGSVLQGAPAALVRQFLGSFKRPDETLLAPPEITEAMTEDQCKAALSAYPRSEDKEIIGLLEGIAGALLDMGQDKGRPHSTRLRDNGCRMSTTTGMNPSLICTGQSSRPSCCLARAGRRRLSRASTQHRPRWSRFSRIPPRASSGAEDWWSAMCRAGRLPTWKRSSPRRSMPGTAS